MKAWLLCLCLMVSLTACQTGAWHPEDPVPGSVGTPDHSHSAALGNNVVEHKSEGYCGNTVTTVRYTGGVGKNGESWERSFWGANSVILTDLLRWLDYRDDVCRCLPEYYVKTEFSQEEYGINLSEGYVRFGGKQTSLTTEQTGYLQSILAEVKAGG